MLDSQSQEMSDRLQAVIASELEKLGAKVAVEHASLLEPITSLGRITDAGERIYAARQIRMRDRGHRMFDQPPFFEIGDAFDAVNEAAGRCLRCRAVSDHVLRSTPAVTPGFRWRFLEAGGVVVDEKGFLCVPVKELLASVGSITAFGIPMRSTKGLASFAVLVDMDRRRTCLADARWAQWLELARLETSTVYMRRVDDEILRLTVDEIDWSDSLDEYWSEPEVPEGARSLR